VIFNGAEANTNRESLMIDRTVLKSILP